ncbi:precorrin-6A/cobalt-precorrin-6A reductase, partial [Kitasatospora sp. NPDC059817]|uniref:precorrin-6A/cobalt-precorrin-6A reductase n=1 Tax=Kitasatospora sp. NPDC059817 TaxID=3346961 RepID=UPI0036541133
MTRHVLILGGTTEGRALAAALVELPSLRVTSSLAGRVAQPRLPAGEVRIGGFGGPDGLADWLRGERVDAVIDATHPVAARVSPHPAPPAAPPPPRRPAPAARRAPAAGGG